MKAEEEKGGGRLCRGAQGDHVVRSGLSSLEARFRREVQKGHGSPVVLRSPGRLASPAARADPVRWEKVSAGQLDETRK